jgi:hypothetical protein
MQLSEGGRTMREERWFTAVRSRLGLALLAGVGVTTLFVEGVFDNPWISLFRMPLGIDEGIVERPKLVVLLMAPVLGYLVAPRSIQKLWRDFLIIVAICCFMASGLDFLFRLPKPKNDAHLSAWWHPRLPWIWRFDPNLDIRGVSYGDLAGRTNDQKLREPRYIVFQTDRAGFRNTHDGERVDLLVLGDSFGAGLGTTQDRVFARLLEAQYGRRVYNLSLPGSPYHEYVNFLLESPNMTFQKNAQVIWTFFTGNDLYENYADFLELNTLPWQEGMQAWLTTYNNFRNRSPLRHLIIAAYKRLFRDSPEPILIRRELPNGQPILFHKLYEEEANLSKTSVERHPHFPQLVRTMVEMSKRAAERGLDVTVVIIPAKEEVYRWILNERDRRPEDANPSGFALAVLDACARIEMACLDATPYLMKTAHQLFDSSGQLLYWRDDTHLNERGHEVMAGWIAREVLHDSGPAPVGSHDGLKKVPLSN